MTLFQAIHLKVTMLLMVRTGKNHRKNQTMGRMMIQMSQYWLIDGI